MDQRVLDFSKDPILPEAFKGVDIRRIIYASGDANGGSDKSINMDMTNIEAYSKEGYNIFCCVEVDERNDNVVYLNNNKELNVVLCILTGNKEIDYKLLIQLFSGSIDLINTDDNRFYPGSRTCFELLKPGGKCRNVHRRFIVGQSRNARVAAPFHKFNSGWAKPNFEIEKQTYNTFTLTKAGKVFNEETNIKNLRAIQENKNSSIANNLRRKNAEQWEMKNKATRNNWKGGKITSSSKTKKRRVLRQK
jgi:hypothetical protein